MRLSAVLFLVLAAGTAGAQLHELLPGSRVRLDSRTSARRLVGTVMAHQGDSVIIASNGALRTAVSYASIYRVQTSEGKSHGAGALRGAKIGAMISGGMGLALGIAYGTTTEVTAEEIVGVTALYAVSGAIWGLAIGAAVGTEKWTTVYQQPLKLAATVTRSGAPGLGVSWSF